MPNTTRENKLEELGRVDAEKAYTKKGKKNLREEKSRIRSELATGGKVKKRRPYHDKTTLHKSQRHPHSTLKTQKEYKTITDSPAYKKADYHTQNKMLKKHPTDMKKGGRIRRRNGGSMQQHYLEHGYGPTKTKLRSGKPKIAIKGWA